MSIKDNLSISIHILLIITLWTSFTDFYILKIIFHTLNEYVIENYKIFKKIIKIDIFSFIFVFYNILNQLKNVHNKESIKIIKIFHSNIHFEK